MSALKIDPELCDKCGICVLACPEDKFAQERRDSIPEINQEETCISCGQCVAACPRNAIKHV